MLCLCPSVFLTILARWPEVLAASAGGAAGAAPAVLCSLTLFAEVGYYTTHIEIASFCLLGLIVLKERAEAGREGSWRRTSSQGTPPCRLCVSAVILSFSRSLSLSGVVRRCSGESPWALTSRFRLALVRAMLETLLKALST